MSGAGPRAAPLRRAVLAMTAVELRLALRRGESLVAAAVLPVGALLFFGSVDVLPGRAGVLDRLVPATAAIAILATSLVGLAITTAYDRAWGVLKRLAGSPLGRAGIVAARVLAAVAVQAAVIAVLVVLAVLVLGWRPGATASPLVLALGIGLGTATFAGLGLAMAGSLRAEATLAVANALFLAAILAGGTLVPLELLPGPLAAVAAVLPPAALVEALAIGLGASGGEALGPLALLGAWAAAASALAAATFRPE